MATLPKIAASLGELDGRGITYVQQFGRVLREAGMLPGGKRGSGAPELNTQHVASLLLGTYGSDRAVTAPAKATMYRQLKLYDNQLEKNPPGKVDPEIYDSSPLIDLIEGGKNFGEVIESLIDQAPLIAKELLRFSKDIVRSDIDLDKVDATNAREMLSQSVHMLHITLYERHAYITLLEPMDFTLTGTVIWRGDFQLPPGFYTLPEPTDRSVSVTFSQNTLIELHRAMNAVKTASAA